MRNDASIELTYNQLLASLKQQVQSAQAKAALAVNSALIELYWNLGKMIAENQALFEGRNNYVEQLAKDLRAEFPDMQGFSKRNIFYCRKFYLFYSGSSVQQAVALNNENSIQQLVGFNPDILSIPWGHHVVLLVKGISTYQQWMTNLLIVRVFSDNKFFKQHTSHALHESIFEPEICFSSSYS